MNIDVDTSELRRLVEDLGKVPARVVPEIAAVVKRGAQNIKTQMIADAEAELAGGHAKHFPRSISYDMVPTWGGIGAEIGPDKARTQGALGNILYFGTSNNGAVLDINGPLDKETPGFLKALADAVAGIVSEAVSSGREMVEYTNRAGVTSTVTAAQAANYNSRKVSA